MSEQAGVGPADDGHAAGPVIDRLAARQVEHGHAAGPADDGPAIQSGRREWPKWLGLAALAVVASVVCLFLANWQWGRHLQRQEVIHQVAANYDDAALPLAEAFASPAAPLPKDLTWHPLTATGRYLPEATKLLRGRTINTDSAYEVLVPFEVSEGPDAGAIWLIDRGYLPARSDGSPQAIPAPPAGTITVTARLQAFERENARTPPAGQVYTIAPSVARVPGGSRAVIGGYGVLSAEQPAVSDMPLALPRPATDFGNHLSYAMQWCVFALAFPLGVVVLYRRDKQAKAGVAPRARREGRAEAEEDAEVERQLTP